MVVEYPLNRPSLWERFIRRIPKAGGYAVVGAIIVGGGTVAGIFVPGEFGPPSAPTNTGPPPTGLANIFIAPAAQGGNDGLCTRNATPINFASAAGHICATPQTACTKSPAGGSVLIEQPATGKYSIGFNLSGCNPSGQLVYANEPGTFTPFAALSTIGSSSNITLQSDVPGHGIGLSLGQTAITNDTNITWNNTNLYCQAVSPWTVITSSVTGETWCSSALNIGGTTNGFTWNGGNQSDWASCVATNSQTQATICTGNPAIPNDDTMFGPIQNVLIENVIFKNYFSIDNSGSNGDHSENWVISYQGTATSNVVFKNNSFTDCKPDTTVHPTFIVGSSCNTAYLFAGAVAGLATADGLSLIQNIVNTGTGATGIAISYDVPAAREPTMKFIGNAISGVTQCGPSTAAPCGPNTNVTANVFHGATTLSVTDATPFQPGNTFTIGGVTETVVTSSNICPGVTCTVPGTITITPAIALANSGSGCLCAYISGTQIIRTPIWTLTGSNMVFANNLSIMPQFGHCFSAATYSHNIWYTTNSATAGTCGATDINGGTQVTNTKFFVAADAPTYDYRLCSPTLTSACANPANPSPGLAAGDPTYCQPTDIYGNPRPTSTPCDIGPVQTTPVTSINPGASNATCSPCTAGTWTKSGNLSVDDGSGSHNVTENYWISRPVGLTGAAPLVVVYENNIVSGCVAGADAQCWQNEAVAGKFVVMDIPAYGCCGSTAVAYPAEPTWTGSGASPPSTCGASPNNNQTCDEIPLVVAALNQVDCAGLSGTCQNIDPTKVYATGGSTAGAFTWSTACDVRTSSLFSAVAPVSNTLLGPNGSNSQAAAGVPPCPALLGTSNGFAAAGSAGLATNNKLSILAIDGDPDGFVCSSGAGAPNTSCFFTGWTDGSSRWHWAIPQLVGFSTIPTSTFCTTACNQGALGRGNTPAAGSDLGVGKRDGCPGTSPITSSTSDSSNPGPAYIWNESVFTNCTRPNVAVGQISVINGGHVPDSKPGGLQAQLIWQFFSSYGGAH